MVRHGGKAITAVAVLAALVPAQAHARPEPSVPTSLRVSEIQGTGPASQIVGAISTLSLVVTATADGGFWAQSSLPDDDPKTSDGIFVRTGAAAETGDLVLAHGVVAERDGLTEFTADTVEVMSHGAPLPVPVPFDGRDAESLEGMRVAPSSTVALGPSSEGRVAIKPGLVLAGVPDMNTGDSLLGPQTGIVDGTHVVVLSAAPQVVPGPVTPRATRAQFPGELALASVNVRNLDPSDDPGRFSALADEIVNGLAAPDLVLLQGVEDNSGPDQDGTVADDQTIAQLIDEISSVGGPDYDWRAVDPVDDSDGGEPGGNPRVGYLFRTDRGLGFTDRPGDSVTATSVDADGDLTLSPGRLSPADPAWKDTRKPLAAQFSWAGRRLVVVNGHWTADGPPSGSAAPQRKEQAKNVAAFVATIRDPATLVVVAGEFNDTIPLQGLQDLSERLPRQDRYSKVVEGRRTATDRILVTPSTAPHAKDFAYVRWNADFSWSHGDADPAIVRLVP
ncbi:endonuclease/exonuclease/phosphatase family protein [Actinocorallia longicatena]|uniref:Endonuclease/exonuclease/phosphatase family protein n=1 Tax=Actinocorallia longicatena TaxID=111803 RepID=A0ABP6Q1E4_9ACTN